MLRLLFILLLLSGPALAKKADADIVANMRFACEHAAYFYSDGIEIPPRHLNAAHAVGRCFGYFEDHADTWCRRFDPREALAIFVRDYLPRNDLDDEPFPLAVAIFVGRQYPCTTEKSS